MESEHMSEGHIKVPPLPRARVDLNIEDGKAVLSGDVDGFIREVEEGAYDRDPTGLTVFMGWLLALLKQHNMLPGEDVPQENPEAGRQQSEPLGGDK